MLLDKTGCLLLNQRSIVTKIHDRDESKFPCNNTDNLCGRPPGTNTMKSETCGKQQNEDRQLCVVISQMNAST